MKRTIVIKAHLIGNTQNADTKASGDTSGPFYKVLPRDPSGGITGRRLEDLRPGDVVFLSGREQHIIIKSIKVKYVEDYPTDEIYILGMDGSMYSVTELAVVNGPVPDPTKATSEPYYKVIPDGANAVVGRRLQDLEEGDMVFIRGETKYTNPCTIDAIRTHYAGSPRVFIYGKANGELYPEDSFVTVDKECFIPLTDEEYDGTEPVSTSPKREVKAICFPQLMKNVVIHPDIITGISVRELNLGDVFFCHNMPMVVSGEKHTGAACVDAVFYGSIPICDIDRIEQGGPANTLIKVIRSSDAVSSIPFCELHCGDIVFIGNRRLEFITNKDWDGDKVYYGNNMLRPADISPHKQVSADRLVKAIKRDAGTITGVPFRELEQGDAFYSRGKLVFVNSATHRDDIQEVRNRHLWAYFPEDAEPFEPDTVHEERDVHGNGDRLVKVIKDGVSAISGVRFQNLTFGDIVFVQGVPHMIKDCIYSDSRTCTDWWGKRLSPEDLDAYEPGTSVPKADVQDAAENVASNKSGVEARLIKVIKHGTNTISGIPLSELSWGDTFFVHGIPAVNYTETLDSLKRNFYGFWGKPFSFDDVDAYEPTKVTQADVQEPAKNATLGESRKSDTPITNDSRIVKGVKKGTAALTGILFQDLKVGDTFFQNGKPITVGENAHMSGDVSYDGYLVYDWKGNSYFPEDADPFELEPQTPKADNNHQNGDDVIRVVKAGTTTITAIPFRDLQPGDTFFYHGEAKTVGDAGAHLSEDASYDGYLVYDHKGNSYFPEDVAHHHATRPIPEMPTNGDRVIHVIKKGETEVSTTKFLNLKAGDTFFVLGQPVVAKEDVRLAGDIYDLYYVTCDKDNLPFIPEDVDLLDMPISKKVDNKDSEPVGFEPNNKIFVKRKNTIYQVFSYNLAVGDRVVALNRKALKEENSDRCAVVCRDGRIVTITVSMLKVGDKVLALL